jgi:hypothetical protein
VSTGSTRLIQFSTAAQGPGVQGLRGCGGEDFSRGKRFAGGFPMRNWATPFTVSGGPTWEDVFPLSLAGLDLCGVLKPL